jgi:hypothetical protein
MDITKIPLPDETLTELLPLTSALYDYFPEAAKQATVYFRSRERDLNSTLLACMIRYEVKECLSKVGIPVEEEEDDEVFHNINVPMERLANNGFEGTYNSYRFKILKSDDGLLPIPQSPKKCQYYGQQLSLEMGIPPEFVRPNIVILWAFDPAYEIVHLLLSVPKEGGRTRATVKDYYTVPIPHPVTTLRPTLIAEPKEPIIEPEITIKETESKQIESIEEREV